MSKIGSKNINKLKVPESPVVLAILDGWGYREETLDNAIRKAHTPIMDSLWNAYPHTLVNASGADVGLPDGQMGNSEVGHLTIGSGRIIQQELVRITNIVKDNQLSQVSELKEIENSIVTGIDKSIMSLQVSKKNSAELNVENVTFFEMDILNQYPKEKFDLVISNPPYVPKREIPVLMKDVKDFEPEIALTDFDDGLTFYKRISKIIPHILKDDSLCILELGLGNHPEKVLSIFKESGYSDMEIFYNLNN